MCIFTRIWCQFNIYMCKTCPNMLHKYVLFKHVYVAGIRWNYTLHKYVLFRHLYVPDIRCNHTFYFNVYTLRIYVAIIRCNYTLCFDMYTLQLYAAIIRSAWYAYMCIFARMRYFLDRVYVQMRSSIRCWIRRFCAHICYLCKARIRALTAQIRCRNTLIFDMYTLQLYAATIRSIYAITR